MTTSLLCDILDIFIVLSVIYSSGIFINKALHKAVLLMAIYYDDINWL